MNAGLLSEDELTEFDSIVSPQSKYWQPIQWLFSLVTVAKEEGLIADTYMYVDLIDVSGTLKSFEFCVTNFRKCVISARKF